MSARAGRGLLLWAALAAACAPAVQRPTLTEAIRQPSAAEQLRRDLRLLFTDNAVDHALWAVHVYSLKHGETVYSFNAFRFMIPASNQKLLTSAAAAERLGWDHRFTTRLYATAPIDAEGLLDGDLVVTSDGDPTINPRHPERWQAFDAWAKALAARGLKIVRGDLVGDDDAFEEPGWGDGWAWDDLQYGYSAPATGLQYHENQAEVTIGPGMAHGARAIISTSPIGSGLVVDHRVVTVPAGVETRVSLSRVPGSPFLTVSGQIALDAKPLVQTAAVPDPTAFYLYALREALARHGIFVAGRTVDVDELRSRPDLTAATLLVTDRSPPLRDIIDVTLKWSRNIYAETMLHALAPAGAPATAGAGLEALQRTLRTWGIFPDFYRPRDGSGLSRYDYVTADALTWLMVYLYADPRHDQEFRATLPVAGESGTLATRMRGTAAAGRVRAKTGTLSNVRGLTGYLTTLDDEPMAFSILVNHFRVPPAQIDDIVDRALVRLVEFRRDPDVPPTVRPQ